jgi:hypothetical protein
MPDRFIHHLHFGLDRAIDFIGFDFERCGPLHERGQIIGPAQHHIMIEILIGDVGLRASFTLNCLDLRISLRRAIINHHVTGLTSFVIRFIARVGIGAFKPFTIGVIDLRIPKLSVMAGRAKLALTKRR